LKKAAMSGVDYLLKITFEPMPFDTNESELKEGNTQFLAELALLMQDTPDLQIKTCALVTYADLGLADAQVLNEQQKAQLKALGDERQNNLKRYLVDEGIASNRVLYCAPELYSGVDAVPRVELKIN
jgi:outer membrane protein OmpA-like peptidoglycan-associated protein